ncbi:MAG: DUF5615 family PIN-like protein [Fimbriimonadales bacterium]|nr:DUF5615 family PIN-like protein [Fimbriimonadales bacterium]
MDAPDARATQGRLRFYLDESVPRDVALGLRRRGIEAIHSSERSLSGSDDITQITQALIEEAILVSHDYDHVIIACQWLQENRFFYGVIYAHMGTPIGEMIRKLQAIAESETFADWQNRIFAL